MPYLGSVASAFRFEGEHLDIAKSIRNIKTADRIQFKQTDDTTLWSIGMDSSKNWTLRNESIQADSINASTSNGHVTFLGDNGVDKLVDLSDVSLNNIVS